MLLVGIRPIIHPERLADGATKKRKPALMGTDREHPYWQENGWRKFNGEYKGEFVTEYGSWRGIINESYFGRFNFYILDPPEALLKGEHWACFTHKGRGRYFIHFSRKPKDISSGIITVESLISESFRAEMEAI